MFPKNHQIADFSPLVSSAVIAKFKCDDIILTYILFIQVQGIWQTFEKKRFFGLVTIHHTVIDKSHISFKTLCRVSVVDAKSKGLSDSRVVCWAQVLTCYRRKLCTILCINMLWHTLRKIWYVPAQWSYVIFYQLNVIITVGARRLPMTYDTHPYNPSNPI